MKSRGYRLNIDDFFRVSNAFGGNITIEMLQSRQFLKEQIQVGNIRDKIWITDYKDGFPIKTFKVSSKKFLKGN